MNGTDKVFYEYLQDYPERARRLWSAFEAFTTGPGFEMHHMVNGFPWGDLNDGSIVVDVSCTSSTEKRH